ncbi:MAG: S8 family peptidase [Lachnospira sp.]
MQKQEDLLTISLEVSEEERKKSPDLQAGFSDDGELVELIVRYVGDISVISSRYPEVEVTELLSGYAIIITPKQYVNAISSYENIEYVEKPKLLYFDLAVSKSASCINQLQQGLNNPYKLTGSGTIVCIIDSGIDLRNKEFTDEAGNTRIIDIWDQTQDKFLSGDEVREYINQLQSLPVNAVQQTAADTIGHGTSVARIACGNNGVASSADIIIVKMGFSRSSSFPRTTQLMQAIDYCIRKGIEYNKPIAINISYGSNYGDHTGTSLLENYIDDVSNVWKSSICIGSGNEGNAATHTYGVLSDDTETEIELAVSAYETSVNIQIWKDYADEFDVEIITPSGRNLGKIGGYNRLNRSVAENTTVLTYYGEPSPYSMSQEIYIDMIPVDNYIQSGIWRIKLIPVDIKTGRFDMWLPAVGALNEGTGFTNPKEILTITIPATSSNSITVGAYNAMTDTFAPFSGSGYVMETGAAIIVKPDLVAPGVGIKLDENTSVTGTSFAVPFVTGGAALLMEWGIVRNNDAYLYAEKLKAYLIKGARKLPGEPVPSDRTGWGALCVKNSIPL